MAYFSTKKQIRTFEYRTHWNINIQKKNLYEKINGVVVNVSYPCTGTTFVKNSCLVFRIVLFDTVGLHLLTFRILESYPSKDILTLMVLL